MTEDTQRTAAVPPTVLPAGRLLMDAAAWVGAACWAELGLHRALTDLLGTSAVSGSNNVPAPTDALGAHDPHQVVALWAVRSHRAELAAAWHQRLPDLREMPRSGFVEPTPETEAILAPVTVPSTDAPTTSAPAADGRLDGLAAVLTGLARHYRAYQSLAVGPADGPTSATLRRAVADTDADLQTIEALRSP